MEYTMGVMMQGEAPDDMLGIAVHPGAANLLMLGLELVLEAYARDPDATRSRLADVAARGDEPFRIPPALLVSDEG